MEANLMQELRKCQCLPLEWYIFRRKKLYTMDFSGYLGAFRCRNDNKSSLLSPSGDFLQCWPCERKSAIIKSVPRRAVSLSGKFREVLPADFQPNLR